MTDVYAHIVNSGAVVRLLRIESGSTAFEHLQDIEGIPNWINADGTKVWPRPAKGIELVTLVPYVTPQLP